MAQRKVQADNDIYIFSLFPFLMLLNQCFQHCFESRDQNGQDTAATQTHPYYIGSEKHGHVTN